MSIEIANESGDSVDEASITSVARFVLDRLRIHPQAELSLLVVDIATMEQLHVQYMDEPGPTDVLSFPMDELRPPKDGEHMVDPGLLGDIVLCPPVAEQQALVAGHTTMDELHLLTTHGILHLLGYDHAEPGEEREMFGLQDELMQSWRSSRS